MSVCQRRITIYCESAESGNRIRPKLVVTANTWKARANHRPKRNQTQPIVNVLCVWRAALHHMSFCPAFIYVYVKRAHSDMWTLKPMRARNAVSRYSESLKHFKRSPVSVSSVSVVCFCRLFVCLSVCLIELLCVLTPQIYSLLTW